MRAHTLVALFSWLIGAGAITYTAERFFPTASQLNAPKLIPHTLAHRGSGRIESDEQTSFLN